MSLYEDDQLLKRRFQDLARRADRQGICTYSGFLSLHELSLLAALETSLPVPVRCFGGLSGCERQIARFGFSEEEELGASFPICCLCIRPLQQRFADSLSHRDLLGALMHLGIERDTLGDILLRDNMGYLFCSPGIAPYITENLQQVKHTSVACEAVREIPEGTLFQLSPMQVQVLQPRVDAIIARAYDLSREESLSLFRAGKVFRNGAELPNNSLQLQADDLISVRGFGRFFYRGEEGRSKKGKLKIRIDKFV